MSKVTINGVEYTPFESGKNAKELGIDLSRKFIVVADEDENLNVGDIVSCTEISDGGDCWDGKCVKVNDSIVWIKELAYYDEQVKKSEPLKNTIIVGIKDESQHKRVQEKLFEMGCEWRGCGKEISEIYSRENHIVIESDYKMTYWGGENIEYVRRKEREKGEITADEFLGEEKQWKPFPEVLEDELHNDRVDAMRYGMWPMYGVQLMENKLNNTPTDMPKPIVKGNKIMSIVNFFNDLTVSSEDKDLRKSGLKDGELNWTSAARQVVLNLEAKDRGYKSIDELASKVGDSSFGALELDALFTKFYSKLLETAKKFNKREEKK